MIEQYVCLVNLFQQVRYLSVLQVTLGWKLSHFWPLQRSDPDRYITLATLFLGWSLFCILRVSWIFLSFYSCQWNALLMTLARYITLTFFYWHAFWNWYMFSKTLLNCALVLNLCRGKICYNVQGHICSINTRSRFLHKLIFKS